MACMRVPVCPSCTQSSSVIHVVWATPVTATGRATPVWHLPQHRCCEQVRVPTNVVCSISDDRGEEPTFNGVTMSTLIEGTNGVADVISLLWFKRQLPKYATRFIEMCVMLCADHGPCVSGGPCPSADWGCASAASASAWCARARPVQRCGASAQRTDSACVTCSTGARRQGWLKADQWLRGAQARTTRSSRPGRGRTWSPAWSAAC